MPSTPFAACMLAATLIAASLLIGVLLHLIFP